MSEREQLERDAARANSAAQDAEATAAADDAWVKVLELGVAADPPVTSQADLDAAVAEATRSNTIAAAKRRIALKRMDALNQYDLNAIQVQIAAATAALNEARRLNGIKITSDYNYEEITLGDIWNLIKNSTSVRIMGGESKSVLGAAFTAIFGDKLEVVLATKSSITIPYEIKHVVGANINFIAGIKRDVIGGAKWDHVDGAKLESHAGVKVTSGPSANEKHPAEQWLVGKLITKYRSKINEEKDTEEQVGSKDVSIKTLLEKIGSASHNVTTEKANISSLEQKLGVAKIKVTNHKIACSGYSGWTGKSSAVFNGGSGSYLSLKSSAGINKGNSGVEVSSGQVKLSAPGKHKIL